jgi:hypothetical protein
LIKYITTENGIEWFGEVPSHEALSAYGLMQFIEMGTIMPSLVNQDMVAKLKEWILSRRDGKGGFLLDSKALDSFGRAP